MFSSFLTIKTELRKDEVQVQVLTMVVLFIHNMSLDTSKFREGIGQCSEK